MRENVQFLDLYGGVLGGWIDTLEKRCCVILVDIAPYADVGIAFANRCTQHNTDLVLFADEYGIAEHIRTPHIITMKTKTGLILESTAGLTSALNVLLHCVASEQKEHLKKRLVAYRERVENLNLYRTGA